jgi:hypothetical protein
MPVRKAQWKSDTQFDFGSPTKTNVETVGSGDSAYIALTAKSDNSDDIPFTTPANYTYDNTKIEVVGGKAKLKATTSGDNNWPFTASGNYTFDAATTEVTGGVGRLKGTPIFPYAWYHLNESSGTNAPDVSGNSRDGTLTNMEDGDWQAGKLNNCLNFDGVDEYVDLGDIADFARTQAFSVECWIKTNVAATQFIVARQNTDAAKQGWALYIRQAAGNFRAAFILSNNIGGGTYVAVENTSTDVNDNAWHHIFVTYDGSGVAAGITVYVDNNSANANIFDALGANSINTTVNANIGARNGDGAFSFGGLIDEVVIYDEEVPAIDVAYRYNATVGTEDMRLGYSKADPDIIPNTGFVFSAPLSTFTETATKPSFTAIKYQVSSDNGVTWKWWNGAAWAAITGGQTDSWYYTNESNSASTIQTNFASLANSGTFKFRAFLHTDESVARPLLDNIYIAEGTAYPLGNHEIAMATDIEPTDIFAWLVVTETVTKPANTTIFYKHSEDSGSTYNASWLTAAQLQTELQAISSPAKTRLKLQLTTTDVSSTPEADNVNITSDAGYNTPGTYTSIVYQPENNTNGVYLDSVEFNVTTPTGTTLTIEVRHINHTLELGYVEYESGDDIEYCGDIIQFKATLATTTADTPKLNWIEVAFHTLIGIMRSIDVNSEFNKDVLGGRWKLDDTNNQWVIYKSDNVTEVARFNLKDRSGNAAFQNIFDRVRA